MMRLQAESLLLGCAQMMRLQAESLLLGCAQ
jgi:hypothetical protein